MLEVAIRSCARAVRRWAKRSADRLEFQADLSGMCAIASARLMTLLQQQGLEASVRVWSTAGNGHCYVECAGYLVDVTSSQFGRKPVEVHALNARPVERYWRGRHRFETVAELRKYMTRAGWPEEQMPEAT